MSDPCPDCGKLHSILSAPERKLDSEGVLQLFVQKICICGTNLGEFAQSSYATPWRMVRAIKNNAVSQVQDEESQAVMVLWDGGERIADIARIVGLDIARTRYVITKIIKAYPNKRKFNTRE